MVIHISHANNKYQKTVMRMCADGLLAATPSESNPRQMDVA